jgi:hypothetical protein
MDAKCESIELPPAEQLLTGELSMAHRELLFIPSNRKPDIHHKSATFDVCHQLFSKL